MQFILFSTLLAQFACVASDPYRVAQLPNPQKEYGKCNMRSPSNICNLDEVLYSDDAKSLARQLSSISSETKCRCEDSSPCRGLEIGIAVFNQLYIGGQTKSAAYKEVADQLNLRNWKLSSCDNSIIVILGKDDGKIHISTSPNVGKYISDEDIKNTLQVATPYLKDKDYVKGLEEVIDKLKYYESHSSSGSKGGGTFSNVIVLILLIGGGAGLFFGRSYLLKRFGYCKDSRFSSLRNFYQSTNCFHPGNSAVGRDGVRCHDEFGHRRESECGSRRDRESEAEGRDEGAESCRGEGADF